MYNVIIAFVAGTVVFAVTGYFFSPLAGILPALLVQVGLLFVLLRRTGDRVQAAMAPFVALMQEGRIDEARAVLLDVRERYGNWQLLMHSTVDAQLGMIDYTMLKFDKAKPQLEAGRTRNWTAMTALGCIAYRKGDRTKAWEEFDAAAGAESKEAIIYAVWAVLAVRAGERERALKALAKGLEAVPESDFLRGLQKTVQNKKKIQTKKFPESWFQFFPEDMMKQHMTRGRRDGGGPVQQAMRQQLGAKPGAKAIHRMR